MYPRTLLALLATALLALGLAPAAAAAPPVTAVVVTGDVAAPASYSPEALAALPQTTLPIRRSSVTGVSVQELVARAAPRLTDQRNAFLRVVLTVTGRSGRSTTFALGELDPGFGDRPALLVPRGGRTDLVVPGDRTQARSVRDVRAVTVVVPTTGPSPVAPGSVLVLTGRGTRTLDAALLGRLPARTRTVTYLAGGTPETRTESGPPLALVLAAAGVVPLPDTAVVAIGTDAYGAAVTVGEALFGDRPLLLSLREDGVALTQPRLVPDGGVRGGRYVSGVVVLDVRR